MIVLLFISVLFGGCAGYRLSHVHGNLDGNAISTPYGPLSGNIAYDAETCFGNCPKANMEVLTNADRL